LLLAINTWQVFKSSCHSHFNISPQNTCLIWESTGATQAQKPTNNVDKEPPKWQDQTKSKIKFHIRQSQQKMHPL
jgi:hypothetical protein